MYEAHGGTNGATKAPGADGVEADDRKVGTLARARRAVLSDDRLARQAAAGDIGAFEAIFSRYQDDLYRFCVGILREPQDAQDAVQNTMLKAMRALPGERRAMQLKPWLYRIAHNEAVELRRRERPVEQLPETVDDVGVLTDERAEENGRLRTLLADIADLPERQRASLVLREVNGLGFGEIGAALGTSPGAVRQALYEARRCLAEMDNGRDMQCDTATRVVSDADGHPRDRGVRAHLRACSPCRRFQAEISERGRTFAAISPLPAIVAAGALKAALGGSGAAAG
ncbi:MAG: RNA polymerase sigma factor, partial [Solirubrobacterales bacterium]